MNAVAKGALLLLAGLLGLSACSDYSEPNAPIRRSQHLSFDYYVLNADPVRIRELNQGLENGTLDWEQPGTWGVQGEPCRYEAGLKIVPEQRDPDTNLDEHTQPPVMNAFGNRNSPGFNFLIYGAQARNEASVCGDLMSTVQGFQLVSSSGHASREWHTGDTAGVVMRPEMGRNYLGRPVEFTNQDDNGKLIFQHAVDSVDPDNQHIQGRFRFLATSPDRQRLVIATNGTFGMNNTR